VNAEVASFDVSAKRSQQSKRESTEKYPPLAKSEKAEIPEDSSFFYQFVLPSAVKSKNKPDRAATAADREVAVIPAAPFIPVPPPTKIPVPAHATRFPFLTNGKLK
jgi:hypothetical protein